MSPPMDTNISTFSFPDIAELLEHILLHLEHVEIVVVTGVSPYWRNCVNGSDALKRKIHKLPVLCTGDANPHFEELTEECKDAIIPRFKFAGPNLWSTVREMEGEWITSLHEGFNSNSLPENLTEEEQSEWLENSFTDKLWELRMGFMGVRIPEG
jgi:hypothetical protein